MTTSAVESRHPATSDPWWTETWGFDWGLSDGSLGGFTEVTVAPRQRGAWFVAAVAGVGRRYVLCRDVDLAPPSNPDVLELRGVSLWTHAICETPLQHWTVAMEAFAVGLDDPYEAWRNEWGDRIGVAFDLEWENDPVALEWTGPASYRLACTVNGDLQIGEESWRSMTAMGSRWHRWGPPVAPVTAADRGPDAAVPAPYLVPGRDRPHPVCRWLAVDGTWSS